MRFAVWAPYTGRVDLLLRGRTVPMSRDDAGCWSADVADASGEADYAFSVDGSAPLPDPRSPWQPFGVHGWSRTVDHAAFAWQHDSQQVAPLREAVIYELHVETFSAEGTFEGAIGRLDYLRGLGITHVELMPVAEFSGTRGWGYDGVDLYAPHHAYGGPHGLQRFVDACHRRDLGVILDVVYNHLGPEGNYLGRFGPYFRGRTPWGEAFNFDGPDSDAVRCFLIDNALAWLRDYRIDGLRIDAVHAIHDDSAVHFLEELGAAVHDLGDELGRNVAVIAESALNDPRFVWEVERGGYGLDAVWSDDLHHALHALLADERFGRYVDYGSIADVAKALQDVYVLDGLYSRFRRRRFGRPAVGVPRRCFVTFSQNHDMVGNRPQGERLGSLAGIGAVKVAAAIVLMAPTVPLLFQGEEWAATTPFLYFTDHTDPELGRRAWEGRRRDLAGAGWPNPETPDPQDVTTFTRSRLDWDEQGREPHAGVLDWYRRLIEVRRKVLAGAADDANETEVSFDEAEGWLRLRRGSILLIANFAREPKSIPLDLYPGKPILISDESARLDAGGVQLPAVSVALFQDPSRS